jgi:PIN domain nuclease of toxin-antitoxin system
VIFLDTHVVAWLYAGDVERIPQVTRSMIDRSGLWISPIVMLELGYLKEIGRLTVAGDRIVETLVDTINLKICDFPFVAVAKAAMSQSWTRDPFDRLITAQASLRDMPLITKDRAIHANFTKARWD